MQSESMKNVDRSLLNKIAQKAKRGQVIDIENYNALIIFASTRVVVQNEGTIIDDLKSSDVYVFEFCINNGTKRRRDFLYTQKIFSDEDKRVTMVKVLNISFEDCNQPSDEFSSYETFWHPVIPDSNEMYLFITSDIFLENFKRASDLFSTESWNNGKSNFITYFECLLKQDELDHSSIIHPWEYID